LGSATLTVRVPAACAHMGGMDRETAINQRKII
jgi:hypothetical protein